MDEAALFPVLLSLRVAAFALGVAGPLGVLLAWAQTRRWPGRGVLDALVLLPMVLPPSVVGYGLVLLFGRHGLAAPALEALGVRLIFSPAGAVVASALVALPLVVKTAEPALSAVPAAQVDVARSLGSGPVGVFFRVILPIAWPGVVAAWVLGFARAIGEFGATLMFAGNIPGRTNTMPIEIFSLHQAGHDERAFAYVIVLTALSAAVVVVASALRGGPA